MTDLFSSRLYLPSQSQAPLMGWFEPPGFVLYTEHYGFVDAKYVTVRDWLSKT